MRVNNIYIKRRKTIFTCISQKYSKIHKRFQKFLIQYLVLNSHKPSWQWTAEIHQNGDNVGNEQDEPQKWLKRLPLKFKDKYFGAIKMFEKFFSAGNFTGNEPQMTFLDHESIF